MFLFVGCSLVFVNRASAENEELAAVASKVSEDYVRTKLPGGTFQTESYAFGKGGHWSGAAVDPTIDKMDFMEIARTIADPLKHQNYIPSTDPNSTKLLIMVYWGTTAGPYGTSSSIAYQKFSAAGQRLARAVENAKIRRAPDTLIERDAAQAEFDSALQVVAVENRQLDRVDGQNASILGFDSALAATEGYEFTALRNVRAELMNGLEANRYFVVLLAYDFQLLWKEKKAKLLWETRFSILERRHEFDKELAAMALSASQYFGKDSGGLIRERLRETNITIGQPKVLEYEPEKGK
jgi:hypothetical protein